MGRVAVITGASRGIGYAAAKRLAGEFNVVCLARTSAPDLPSYSVDVADPTQVRNAFRQVAGEHGIPSLLVNCAGMVEPHGLLEISPAEWERTLAVNLTGTFLCTQEFVRLAKRNGGGKIINIASTAALRPQPGWAAYAAAKAGVVSFSLSMAEELCPYGIRVYCLAPGRCATALRRKLAPDEDPATIMQPEELAELIHYLAVDGRLIDGQVIVARGW